MIMPSDKPVCPLLTIRETPHHLEVCMEKACAWWIPEYEACARVVVAHELTLIRQLLRDLASEMCNHD